MRDQIPIADLLKKLSHSPPQALLLEGGDAAARLTAALYWAKTLNCPEKKDDRPCGVCPVCKQIDALEYLDLHIYDGQISNKQDDEKPGPIRALRMENMRELRQLNANAPHGTGLRVAIFQGLGQTREEALNSLLKTLEEPAPHTRFVLLAPQRSQILPTLVSRSLCLTLPWPSTRDSVNAPATELEEIFGQFLSSGSGFLEKIAGKGALDAQAAGDFLVSLQHSLTATIANMEKPGAATKALRKLAQNPRSLALLCGWIQEAQEMLAYSVTPARVLEALGAKIFCLLRTK